MIDLERRSINEQYSDGRVENGNNYFIERVDVYPVFRFTTFLGLSCVYISKVLR